ncbi:hypothetical protein T261_5951 [Streptomyces lydicus]|nr:hypothetical protein T261_5951 [Streptomyces lydicus]
MRRVLRSSGPAAPGAAGAAPPRRTGPDQPAERATALRRPTSWKIGRTAGRPAAFTSPPKEPRP